MDKIIRKLDKNLKNINKLIHKIKNNNDIEIAHQIRVSIRKSMAILELTSDNSDLINFLKKLMKSLEPLREIQVEKTILNSLELSNKENIIKLYSEEEKKIKKNLLKELRKLDNKFLDKLSLKKNKINFKDYKLRTKILIENLNINNLHKLRIGLKKLRYHFEAINEDKAKIKKLEEIQEILGQSHDIVTFKFLKNMQEQDIVNIWKIFIEKETEILNNIDEIKQNLQSLFEIVLDPVLVLSKKLSPDFEHVRRVEKKSQMILKKLKKEYKTSKEDKEILRISALLHDIGHSKLGQHAENSFDIIMASKELGLTQKDKTKIAIIAKYHTGSWNKELFLKRFTLKEKQIILLLSAILRAADGTEFESVEFVTNMGIKIKKSAIKFYFKKISPELKNRFFKKSKKLSEITNKKIKCSEN
ncbi:MAG: CHAD domain-containing protein [Cetobacterium sp.]|uniref:CHAD domain-containing protein n=2 Tax=Cetobacterium sp. TaxID=2071632 RepID=UPI002FCAD337